MDPPPALPTFRWPTPDPLSGNVTLTKEDAHAIFVTFFELEKYLYQQLHNCALKDGG